MKSIYVDIISIYMDIISIYMDIWVIGKLNEIFIRSFYTDIKFSKKK